SVCKEFQICLPFSNSFKGCILCGFLLHSDPQRLLYQEYSTYTAFDYDSRILIFFASAGFRALMESLMNFQSGPWISPFLFLE
ncbi:hypothetical protein MXB_4310, partial [Myxobolus squamalis]